MNYSDNDLYKIARSLRLKIIENSYRTKTPHLGSCLSCVDILTVLYFHILNIDPKAPLDFKRDRFILSKGHAAPALVETLAMRGFFSESRLLLTTHTLGEDVFGEHLPTPSYLAGVEAATGSLGHGLPIALGMILASKLSHINYRTFVLLGDGECNEGSIWEAALFAGCHAMDNLVVIIDFNKWQATDRSEEVMAINPFKEKWASFGWSSYEVDGHDITALRCMLERVPDGSNKPIAIIAHTVKGKGVSFMEDDNNWHYRTPNESELLLAKQELEVR